MATAVRNPDDTLTVTLTAGELRIIARWSQETGTPAEQGLARAIEDTIRALRLQFRRADSDRRQERFDTLTAQQQAQIDAILGLS